jgi:hypothetical protein
MKEGQILMIVIASLGSLLRTFHKVSAIQHEELNGPHQKFSIKRFKN